MAVYDLNTPPPSIDVDRYRDSHLAPEPTVEFHEALDVADRLFNEQKKTIYVVLMSVYENFSREGPMHGLSAADAADQYRWCVSDVLRAARHLADRGIIEARHDVIDNDPCGCDACVARDTWLSLPYNFSADRDVLLAEKRLEETQALAQARRLVQRSNRRHGFVYLIKCGPRHKIGITSDMNRRMDQLRGQSPYPIELVHYAQGEDNASMEACLHRDLARHRMHGEWFELSPDQVASVIESLNDWQRKGAA